MPIIPSAKPPDTPGTMPSTSSQNSPNPPHLQPARPSIAIIGAGLASLRLAHLLLTSSSSTTTTTRPPPRLKIFEARSRVGGRLHQSVCGAHTVDMGPNWIHGTEGNPMMELARQTGTETMEPPPEAEAEGTSNDVFDREGHRLREDEARFVSGQAWGEISAAMVRSKAAAAMQRREHDGDGDGDGDQRNLDSDSDLDFNPGLGLGDVLASALRGKAQLREGRWGLGDSIEQEKRLRDAIEETRMWGPFIGEPVERQSYRYFYMEECVDGGNLFVASTYKKILEWVARPVLEARVVQFEKEVVKVHVLEEGDRGVKVVLKDGQEEVFDEVVCTAPLGWLKRNEERVFEPRLPESVRRAIGGLGFGRLEKLYVSFPEAWWLDAGCISALHRAGGLVDGHHIGIEGVGETVTEAAHDPRDNPNRPLGIFTHIHAPTSSSPAPATNTTSAKTTPPPSSNLSLVSLAHLPPGCSHPTLLAYLYGDASTALVSSIRGLSDHTPQYRHVLWRFIEPYLRILPGYVSDATKCVPVEGGIMATRWQDDDFAGKGSYSCFLAGGGGGHLEEMVEVLREGEGLTKEKNDDDDRKGAGGTDESGDGNSNGPRRGGLWFAGEHVSPLEGLGTTTGAWWSGEAVAKRLAKKWGFDIEQREADGS